MSQIRLPSSMKLAASRSLLQGTAGSGADGQRPAGRLHLRHQAVVTGRDAEAELGGHRRVPALDDEHVEVAGEPRAGVQLAAGLGDPGDVGGRLDVGVAEGASLDEAQDQQVVLGMVGDDRCADAGLRGGHGVVVLVVAVDGEEVTPAGPDPGDEGARAGGHLVVVIGQAAGELGDRARGAGEFRHAVQLAGQAGRGRSREFTAHASPPTVGPHRLLTRSVNAGHLKV